MNFAWAVCNLAKCFVYNHSSSAVKFKYSSKYLILYNYNLMKQKEKEKKEISIYMKRTSTQMFQITTVRFIPSVSYWRNHSFFLVFVWLPLKNENLTFYSRLEKEVITLALYDFLLWWTSSFIHLHLSWCICFLSCSYNNNKYF